MNKSEHRAWAIVSGACGGVGRELTKRLGAMGISLVLTGRDATVLDKLRHAVESPAILIKTCVVDFDSETWERDCRTVLSAISEENPLVLLFFSNAGYGLFEPYEATPFYEKTSFMQCNVQQHVYLTELLLSSPLKEKLVYVCFTSSIASLMPLPYFGLYHSAKAFLRTYAQALEETEKATWNEACPSTSVKQSVSQLIELTDKRIHTQFHYVMPHIVNGTSFYTAPTVKRSKSALLFSLLRIPLFNTTPSKVVDAMLNPTERPIVGLGGILWGWTYRVLRAAFQLTAHIHHK
ncbi:Hypothetical protein GLP15_2315 [Giardia lamblia P15]|uniref:Short chain dehydrogenase n=1 Tax=Giardia intestinalis (strain P15) TaxID=658858 RepID=E1F170_GIAIA|nr:Hypothetical protein GLP15_2315 [Giardia lamblia P15]